MARIPQQKPDAAKIISSINPKKQMTKIAVSKLEIGLEY
jgi:hypothetical protein